MLHFIMDLYRAMSNSLAMHEESSNRRKVDDDVHEGAIPAYLMDRETTTRAKVCSYCISGSAQHIGSPIITMFCQLTFSLKCRLSATP